MRTAIVCESWFGNTRRIAEAVADALGAVGDAVVFTVDEPRPAVDEFDLLVVGAPTHVHGLSTASSRKAALRQQDQTGPEGIGVRGWLDGLPEGAGRRAAAFDTRLGKPAVLTGSAARGIAKRLERHGFELVVPPESFIILGDNSLEEGELERAATWAALVRERTGAEEAALARD